MVRQLDRLRQRADFLAAAAGLRVTTPGFVVQGRQRDDAGPCRVGYTVSKKVGTATERNRVRRRLRELVRRNGAPLMRPRCDYVLVGRRVALNRTFGAMSEDLAGALKRLDTQLSKRSDGSSGRRLTTRAAPTGETTWVRCTRRQTSRSSTARS
jgi:ribonuclease P protein component